MSAPTGSDAAPPVSYGSYLALDELLSLQRARSVPEQPDAPPPDVLAKRADASATIEKARDLGLLPSAIMLLPVAKEIVTGLQRFETRAAENVKAVDFYLNGSKMMTKTRPP